jgi:hypothetical protein
MDYQGFVGPSYVSQSRIASADRCVNWYPERIESPVGKTRGALYPCPGFELFATLTDSPVRALHHINGRTFAVGGGRFFEISNTGVVTERGSGLNNLDNTGAQIWSNGDGGGQLFVVSGSKGYVYDLDDNTLTLAIDDASSGGYLDGFFLALNPGLSRLSISELMNGATWDPAQVAQRNAGADKWGAMLVSHREIWLFGSATSEVWYNSGASPFPFEKNPGVFIEHGILAPASAAILDNAPIWLGQSPDGGGIVYRANGYQPIRVSTHAIEYALSTYSTLTDAEAWTYQDQGHSFYVLTFPTARVTWVYDASTGMWHERGTWDNDRFIEIPVRCHTWAFGRHLVGGRNTGNVYRMSIEIATDAAE